MAERKRLGAKEELEALVARYDARRAEYRKAGSAYNETQLRQDFVNPLLRILGWDVDNTAALPQHLREVVHEDTVDVKEDDELGLLAKKPDYALRAGGERKLFWEAKKPSIAVETSAKAAFQVRRYGWNARMAVSVLTNFEMLVIYDCRVRPRAGDGAKIAKLNAYSYMDFVPKFEELRRKLSRDSVFSGEFDKQFPIDREVVGKEAFDGYFLEQIESWRLDLARELINLNPRLSQRDLNLLIQRLINRIIFLRICEDRELEKYKSLQNVQSYADLKKLFIQADEKYNSGLFGFAEDQLALKVEIGSEVLVKIFKELYYPQSPYAFSVVEPTLLGEIYELFLGRMVRLSPGGFEIAAKPEIVESGGVVPTPRFIVDEIVRRSIERRISSVSPKDLATFRVADIASGSGTFLIQAYNAILNRYLEAYLKEGPSKHVGKIYEGPSKRWFLTLAEKQRILLSSIFGVDIDIQAVEVTRFGLLLKILENEKSDPIKAFLKDARRKALPNLDDNIRCGNSLVDPGAYLKFDPNGLDTAEKIEKVNPLEWKRAFPQVAKSGGFDAIVGNPPYIRIQNMVKYSPDEARFYQSPESPYACAKSDNFDKYALFVERALMLLKKDGALGYIVPHKFFVIKSGKALRKLLSDGRLVQEIVHFGAKQVFGKRTTTYTCILLLDKRGVSKVKVEHVHDLEQWKYQGASEKSEIPSTALTGNAWELVPPSVRKLFERIRNENPTRLKDVAKIFVGVQTSADKIYLIKPSGETATSVTFEDRTGKSWTVEKGILRPALLDVEFLPFGSPVANTYIIFPYKITNGKAAVFTPVEMETKFPKCLAYLTTYKATLATRNLQNPDDDAWYQFGRSQSLTTFDGTDKLIWPILSRGPRYNYDPSNVVITGGGNGPYYALRPKEPGDLIFYIQALLSHPVLDAMVASRASVFRGGYVSHGKQFIAELPIRLPDRTKAAERTLFGEIVGCVKDLNKAFDRLRKADTPEKKRLGESLADGLRRKLYRLVEKAYGVTEEEANTAIDYLRSSFPGDAE